MLLNKGTCIAVEPEMEYIYEGLRSLFLFQIAYISEEIPPLLKVAVSKFFRGEEAAIVSLIWVVVFLKVVEDVFIDMDVSWIDRFFSNCWWVVDTVSNTSNIIFWPEH